MSKDTKTKPPASGTRRVRGIDDCGNCTRPPRRRYPGDAKVGGGSMTRPVPKSGGIKRYDPI